MKSRTHVCVVVDSSSFVNEDGPVVRSTTVTSVERAAVRLRDGRGSHLDAIRVTGVSIESDQVARAATHTGVDLEVVFEYRDRSGEFSDSTFPLIESDSARLVAVCGCLTPKYSHGSIIGDFSREK